MNATTLRLLGFIVVFLFAAWLLIEAGDEGSLPESGQPLFGDMQAVLNDIDELTIARADAETVTIRRDNDRWVHAGRDGYPANVANIRNVLLAMAEATVVEPKTADPARHGLLGVTAPEAQNSKGVLVTAAVGEQSFAVIFGNTAQGNYRYARIADQDQSWLIDQNPEIPTGTGNWLIADIVDIDASRISEVTITHPDDEVIRISKAFADDVDFTVNDVPEGRELSYSTVANGIGGALNDLDLDDVRTAGRAAAENSVVTEFRTFDGMVVIATTSAEDDGQWLSLEVTTDGKADDAAAIRTQTSGWTYRIADYKSNLLTRRWDDILKAEDE
jgi:hypothetical protein